MKPILINGFWRSGTTYLFRYLKWISNGKALNEPVTSPHLAIKQGLDIRDHPKINKLSHFSIIFDKNRLANFLNKIKDYSIKEVSLHLYLNEEFIKNNWDVYFIIRHPGDTFLSFINTFIGKKYLYIKILEKLRVINLMQSLTFIRNIFLAADELAYFFGYKRPSTFMECFVLLWTISNYYALNSIDIERQLIIYEKPESYHKLPKWVEWIKIEPLKIKKYKARIKYEKKFYRIAKKLGIAKEFEEIMKFIKQ